MAKTVVLTDEQIQILCEDYKKGISLRIIGKNLNIDRSVVNRYLKENNVQLRDSCRIQTDYQLCSDKLCKQCQTTKNVLDFPCKIKNNKKYYSSPCIECTSKYSKKYGKNRYKEKIQEFKDYYELHHDDKKKYNKEYHEKNKERLVKYRENRKEKDLENIKTYNKNRRQTDPTFKLRGLVSSSIKNSLKKLGSDKFGKSIVQFLGYTIEDLKKHLELQFDSWMNWDNHGKYIKKTWKDEDLSTWKWQIDHIIPHSDLLYTSMEDENFKKCWALSNLRPLSAKQNQLDGSTRIRHKKYI